ncbi:MAG: hypothetical protein LQ339_005604 [Xanthoria mediterranea]|nr:MAG: hypothetical protein LQ339_005604 [Xanthoria mediterranea]
MHHQCTTSLAALLLLLSPTTFAAAMPPSGSVAPMAKPVCKSAAIAIAANRAPDCSMARCTDDGKLSLLGAPEQCMKNCECPVPSQGMEVNSTPGMGPAPVVKGNPVGTTYTATLPESEKSGIRGFVSGSSGADGQGVDFTIELSGFPDGLGPFSYHIHDQPVPADGNCTATKAHLDPYKRGPMPPCNSAQFQTCEVGDLSGKHGKINPLRKQGKTNHPEKLRGNVVTNSFGAKYTDLYLSTMEGSQSFFGSRSVVIHQRDSTRLTCANFVLA